MSGKIPWVQLTVASAGSTHVLLFDVLLIDLNGAYTVMGLGYTLLRGEHRSGVCSSTRSLLMLA